MAVLSDYVTGTITLTNGLSTFTGTGTGWEAADFKEGDTIIDITGATEYMGVVATITGEASGTLTKPWEGPTLANVSYRMRYQPDGSRATAQARQLIEILGNGNITALASLNGSANHVPMFTGPGAMTLVPKTDLVSGANYDVQVPNIAARATYNGQDTGFAVLVSNVGDGRAAIYSKRSATNADWSAPAYVTGPVGPTVTFTAGDTTTLPSGADATVAVVPVSGGYELDIGVPRGLQGIPGNDGATGNGLEVDASGTLAGRSAYDSQLEGFTYLDTTNGNLYFRQTAVPGTWSPAVPFVGPSGASGAAITTTNGTGDGTVGPYTLSAAPLGLDNVLFVSISGVQQYDYSIVSNQVVFGQAVPVGVPWQVKTSGPLSVGAPSAGTVVSASITNDSTEQGLIRTKLNIPLLESTSDYTIYVATTGNDTTGDGTIGNPFATPQRAWDSLPTLIKNKIIINIANGVYSTSSRPAASLDRPALIYCDGKKLGRRTDAPGGVMTGAVVFMGQSKAGVIFRPAASYTRGIYVTGHVGSVGFQNFTIDAQAGSETGIVAHRGSYVHASDIDIDGNGIMTFGAISEAGGFMEGLYMSIHDVAIGVQAYQDSTIQLSLTSTISACSSNGIQVVLGGYVGLTTGSSCSSNVLVTAGGFLDTTGLVGSRITLSGTVQTRGGYWTAAYTDVTGNITTYPGSQVNVGAFGWSSQWTDYGADIYAPGAKSYVSPATQSAVATPYIFLGNGQPRFYFDSTAEFKNSSGVLTSEDFGHQTYTVPSDGVTIPLTIRGRVNTLQLNASAPRSNISLPTLQTGRFANTPIPDGTILQIFGTGGAVTIIENSTADIAGDTAIVGSAVGNVILLTCVWSKSLGKWMVSKSGVR